MIIYGGVYRESIEDPRPWATVFGSGLRAATLLADEDVTLIAPIDAEIQMTARSVAAAAGLSDVVWHHRSEALEFRYELPISRPAVPTPQGNVDGIEVHGDRVLVFGAIEGCPDVRAGDLIVDPQYSLSLDQIDGFSRDRLVVIANQHEVRRLADCYDVPTAAEMIRLRLGAAAVVAKLGALGTWLQSEGGEVGYLPSVPTARSWPIGSGDAFTAGFARAWFAGRDLRAAVESGRTVAAHWCATRSVPARPLAAAPPAEWASAIPPAPQIYLAGPFFNPGERMLVRRVRAALADLGASVFSPMHDVGFGGPEVAHADLAGLANATAVLALVDGSDAGTLFEVGWAVDRGIPVVAFAENLAPNAGTMLRGSDVRVVCNLADAVYLAVFAALDRRK